MKTKEQLYEDLLKEKLKIPKDIFDIYLLKKENLNRLKLDSYNYDKKISFLDNITKELMKKIQVENFLVWAWNFDMDNWNSFHIDYRSDDNKIDSPFNIIVSVPFKYYYIDQFRDQILSENQKIIIEKIKFFLEDASYRHISKDICDIQTDIIWVNSMPYKNHEKVHMDMCEEFETFTEERKKEYREGILEAYDWPYTIYNVIFWEHW